MGVFLFPSSAHHEQDWQAYPVDPYSAVSNDHRYILVQGSNTVCSNRLNNHSDLFIQAAPWPPKTHLDTVLVGSLAIIDTAVVV